MEERFFKDVVAFSSDGIVITDAGVSKNNEKTGQQSINLHHIVYVNDAYVKMTGYSREELIGKSPKILQGPLTSQTELDSLRQALLEGRSCSTEVINYRKDRQPFWSSLSVYPIKSDSGEITNWIGIKRDVSERRNHGEEIKNMMQMLETKALELQKSGSELSMFFNNALFGAFFMMLDEPVRWDGANKETALDYIMTHLRVTRVNQAFLNQYGATEEDMMGKTPMDFFEHDLDQERKLLTTIFDKKKHREITFEKRTDGTDVVFEGDYVALYDEDSGLLTGVFGVQNDITLRKTAEMNLQASLREKETLLQEIHHRVKNNLAVVSSLMQLQSFESNNPELKEQLLDSTTRIQSMSMIHEALYKSEKFDSLQLSVTIRDLHNFVSSVMQLKQHVETLFDTDEVTLNINQAVPFSLIVNEVLTNIYKHAFRDRDSGRILIRLRECEDGFVELRVRDNGVGLAKDFSLNSVSSLGFQLIRMLTLQLEGESSLENAPDEGTCFWLKFPKQDAPGAHSGMNFSGKR
jgi:PAS domain S-box-containing protein